MLELAEVLEMRSEGSGDAGAGARGLGVGVSTGAGAGVAAATRAEVAVATRAEVAAATRASLGILDEARQLFARAVKGSSQNRAMDLLRQGAERGEVRCSKLPPFVSVLLFFRRGGAWQAGPIGKTDAVWAPTIFDAARGVGDDGSGSGGGGGSTGTGTGSGSGSSGTGTGTGIGTGVGGDSEALVYRMVLAQPPLADVELKNPDEVRGAVAVVIRGGGSFDQKVEYAERAGAVAVVVVNHEQASPGVVRPMAGRGRSWRATIPAMMVSFRDGARLLRQLQDFEAGEDAGDDHVGEVAVEAVFIRANVADPPS